MNKFHLPIMCITYQYRWIDTLEKGLKLVPNGQYECGQTKLHYMKP